jgi:hypothetical protein
MYPPAAGPPSSRELSGLFSRSLTAVGRPATPRTVQDRVETEPYTTHLPGMTLCHTQDTMA